jgi:hypothetical protein
MNTHDVRIGQEVRVSWLEREGTIVEFDADNDLARVLLMSDDAEHWVRIDDLQPAASWTER